MVWQASATYNVSKMMDTNKHKRHVSWRFTPCCDKFNKATMVGTDSEEHGQSFFIDCESKNWHTGSSELDDVHFCPWCGKPLPSTSPVYLTLVKQEVIR